MVFMCARAAGEDWQAGGGGGPFYGAAQRHLVRKSLHQLFLPAGKGDDPVSR